MPKAVKAIIVVVGEFGNTIIAVPGFPACGDQDPVPLAFINAINPGVEFEMPVFSKSTISANIGVGYGNMYENTTRNWATGELIYMIAPFIDVEYKYLYNINKRVSKGKKVDFNSANFISLRCLGRGSDLKSNFTRYEDYDFAIGPNWGIQRSFSRVHLLLEVGAIYYTDGTRNGFAPSLQFNLGYNLFKF